jgi:NADH-quinone oxidoreductase subunit E
MAALRLVQEERGWLSNEMMDAVADYLDMEPISVYEVATFYSMYDLKPAGRHKISVCTNISCMLRGSAELMAYLERKLGIKRGETTADGKFVLKEVECLAACGGAPMCLIGKTYHENLTPEKVDAILASLE